MFTPRILPRPTLQLPWTQRNIQRPHTDSEGSEPCFSRGPEQLQQKVRENGDTVLKTSNLGLSLAFDIFD